MWQTEQLAAKSACPSGAEAGCCACARPLEHSSSATVSGTSVNAFLHCPTGIIFILKTGLPWEYLPREMGCGSGMTCWRRLQ